VTIGHPEPWPRQDVPPAEQYSGPDTDLPPQAGGEPVGVLPHGVHPRDNSVLLAPGVPLDANSPTPDDTYGSDAPRGRARWSGSNPADAFPVFQRAAQAFSTGLVVVNATQQQGGTASVVGRMPGRLCLHLWVPTSVIIGGVLTATPAGVTFGPNEDELIQNLNASVLNVGDAIAIQSESPVYVGLVPGQMAGYVQFANYFNPPGGQLGGQ
jgi:hypothetical protein